MDRFVLISNCGLNLEEEDESKPASLCLDSLYCSEENIEEEEEEEVDGDSSSSRVNGDANEPIETTFQALVCPPDMLLSREDDEISCLLLKEKQNKEGKTLEPDPTRIEAVDWILKVVSHYSFSPLTALLSVNYFDRFFSSVQFQKEKPWMNQLAAVACLSLAAKVEEVEVPLLLDLQVEDSSYVFEAKTIQRMEILVLSALEWRMHPVTPLSFLEYFTRRLGLKDFLSLEFTRRCERTLLYIISDSRFTLYRPSVMAAATMLRVIKSVAPSLADIYQSQLISILKINKGEVDECCNVVMELAPIGHSNQSKKRKFCTVAVVPASPNGVMDASFSSDSSNDSWAVSSSSAPPSVSSSPEPLSKKIKASFPDLQRG